MVGPLMLLKMLHCKKKCQRSSRGDELISQSTSTASSRHYGTKQEIDETTCRVCLKNGDIPIYPKGALWGNEISDALATFGGIEIEENDAYPKYLCHPCHALLQGAILFRKTAQQSDQLLKKPQKIKPDIGDDISDDYSMDFAVTVSEETKKRIYHCKKCDIAFDKFNDFHTHKMTEEHETRRQKCPICHNLYAPRYLKKHLALHKGESHYICDVCGKNFVVRGQFSRHRATHFYELPFKCTVCPYRGRFPESLKMHMRTHTGEKPYQCSHCAARFVSKSNLNKHMNTHKEEPDFKCETCGRGFHSKRRLEMHMNVDHTGLKEHVCDICFKAFGYRKQMMKHKLKVHKRQKLRSGRLPLYLQVEKMREEQEAD